MTTPWPDLKRGLVAILRGITPAEAPETVRAIADAGFEAIEIPLNSPDPFVSIAACARTMPDVLLGAGTVLTPEQVDHLARAGGRLLVSPNVDRAVLERATHYGMVTMPGVLTPTEAFTALSAGASALKFFPASVLGPEGVKAMRAVLPAGTVTGAVGGVADGDFAAWKTAGVSVFGLGSSLYRPGMGIADVASRARAAVTAWDAVFGTA